MELQEKVEESFCKYLRAFVTDDNPAIAWPETMNAGDKVRIFPGENDFDKDGQLVVVIAGDGTEYPLFTANFYIPVTIVVRTPLKQLTPDEIANKVPAPKSNHSLASSVLEQAIGGDPFALAAAVNGLAADFTIMGGILEREPVREQSNEYWESGIKFRVLCCGKDLTK